MNACGADAFDGVDPFPDADEKICQCMMPVHDEARANVLEWRWCANEGGRCACDTAAARHPNSCMFDAGSALHVNTVPSSDPEARSWPFSPLQKASDARGAGPVLIL